MKLQDWHPRAGQNPRTKDWSEENNGMTYDDENRNLGKQKLPPWPTDFMIDVAVNGKIVKSYTGEEYYKFAFPIAYMEAFYPLVDDKSIVTGEPVEIGIRLRSQISPKDAGFALTHVYYA